MTQLYGDLRFALRQLIRNPGFSTAALLTIALGIGAVTAGYLPARTAARVDPISTLRSD